MRRAVGEPKRWNVGEVLGRVDFFFFLLCRVPEKCCDVLALSVKEDARFISHSSLGK